MMETFHLLANPNHYQKKIVIKNTIDEDLLFLLNKKFEFKITKENYEKNIELAKKIFLETQEKEIIKEVLNEIILLVTNERVLL
jgi:hypothetical protein